MERIFLKLISRVLKFFRIKYSLNVLKFIYALTVNIFQLAIMMFLAYLLRVYNPFMILFMIYMVFRNLGEHDHFNSLATCFVWSNLLFIPHIIALYFVKISGGNTVLIAVFLGIVSGIVLSQDHVITNWFSYDRTREEVNFNRNKIRMHLYDNYEMEDVKQIIDRLEYITQSDIKRFAKLKYGEKLSNEVVSQRMNISPAFAKKLDEKIIIAFSTYFL